MVKVNTEAFNEVSQTASLTHDNKPNVDKFVKLTSVYNIPVNWIETIKKQRFPVSVYIKEALFEKLRNDKLL